MILSINVYQTQRCPAAPPPRPGEYRTFNISKLVKQNIGGEYIGEGGRAPCLLGGVACEGVYVGRGFFRNSPRSPQQRGLA